MAHEQGRFPRITEPPARDSRGLLRFRRVMHLANPWGPARADGGTAQGIGCSAIPGKPGRRLGRNSPLR